MPRVERMEMLEVEVYSVLICFFVLVVVVVVVALLFHSTRR
jgi:hypothetical protein